MVYYQMSSGNDPAAKERKDKMMPGDMPCNKECKCKWCEYNYYGSCMDNYPCENREKYKDHEEDNEEI